MATIWIRGDLVKASRPKSKKKKTSAKEQPVEVVESPETESSKSEELL